MVDLFQTHGGFVCHQTQFQDHHLCVARAGLSGMGSGCAVHQLGGIDSVRLPSYSDHHEGPLKVTPEQVQLGTAGPAVAEATVVSHATRGSSRLSS